MSSAPAPRPPRGLLLLLRLLSPLVPARHRGRWLHEWRAEIWYAHRTGRTSLSRTLSAFPHAVALRWQETRPEMILVDVRYALRQLRAHPGFALLVIATLGLGIGANSLAYSVLQSTVLSPLQLPDADRIVYLWRNNAESSMQVPPTIDEIESWREQVDGLADVQPIAGDDLTLTGRGEPRRLRIGRVFPGFFRFVGTVPLRGRTFSEDEAVEGRDRVAVLGYRTWRELFATGESAVGAEITLDDEPYVVIGVLPAEFRLQAPFAGIDVWTPLTGLPEARGAITLARLAPGVSLEAVNAELAALATEPAGDGDPFDGWVGTARRPQGMISSRYRAALWSVQGAVLFVLLIAGANTANLLLARGSSHRRELAIREALGAGRARLIRQLLAESLLLSLAGGAVGLAIAHIGVRLLDVLRPGDLGSLETLRLAPSVLWATLALSVACGLLFGLVPALHACGGRLAEGLTEGGRSGGAGAVGGRLRSALVVAEVALSTLLLVGAGLLVHSFVKLQAIDPGFEPDSVLAVTISLPEQRYEEVTAEEFWQQLQRSIRTALGPAVEATAVSSGVPPRIGISFGRPETSEGPLPADRAQQVSGLVVASPSFFETLGIPFVEGGPYGEDPDDGASSVVLNESFARRLWPEGGAVGRQLRIVGGEWRTVRGVVADIESHGLGDSFTDQHLYVADGWGKQTQRTVSIRAAGDPHELISTVRAQTRRLEPDAVIDDAATVAELLGDSIRLQRFNAQVMTSLAALAILLAVIGIYGVLSYSVARRTREMGVRLALGASGTRVLKLVAREGMLLVVVGLTIGLLVSTWLAGALDNQLYEVGSIDPPTYAGVAFLFALIGMLATLLPARRATRVDPVVALRSD